jgi:hypothetical protein
LTIYLPGTKTYIQNRRRGLRLRPLSRDYIIGLLLEISCKKQCRQ